MINHIGYIILFYYMYVYIFIKQSQSIVFHHENQRA